MAESVIGRAVSATVPQSSTLNQARDATVSLNFRQLTGTSARSLCIGTSPTSPATFAALEAPTVDVLGDIALTQTNHPGGGGLDVAIQQSLSAGILNSMTAGHHLYACLFNVAAPISGSVPALVLDLGILN